MRNTPVLKSLTGPERPVKVISASVFEHLLKQKRKTKASTILISGCITQEKYLQGKNCRQIEAILGLRPFEIRNLAYVFSLSRLPRQHEIDYLGMCSHPGGVAFDESAYEDAMAARQDFLEKKNRFVRSHTPTVNFYPPGSPITPQWTFKDNASVPAGKMIAQVTTSIVF